MAAWVKTSERQPEKPGYYEICRAKGEPKKGYYWNGGYWITPKCSPTEAVYSWLDEEKGADADGG